MDSWKLKTHLFRQAYNTAWFLWEQFAEEWNFVIVIVIVKLFYHVT